MTDELNNEEWNKFLTWSTYLYRLGKEKIRWMSKCMSLLSKYPNISSERKVDYIIKSEQMILKTFARSQFSFFDIDKEQEKEYVSHRDPNEHKFTNRPKLKKSSQSIVDEIRQMKVKRKSKYKRKV